MRSCFAVMALFVGYGLAFAPSPNNICKASQKVPSLQYDESSRADFVSKSFTSSLAILLPSLIQTNTANAFDGGVGGLGKTRPVTGVVFRDPEAAIGTSSSGELLAPDGTPVLLSFSAPWPLLKSTAGIEARDIAGGFESAFVQVAEMQKGITKLDQVKPEFLSQEIFGSTGKFGMYGAPSDVKIKKISQSTSGMAVYLVSFTTLTPAMRESNRKAYISASVVGNGLFMLITTTTATRFKKLDDTLRSVADSFSAIPAPKSSLRKVS